MTNSTAPHADRLTLHGIELAEATAQGILFAGNPDSVFAGSNNFTTTSVVSATSP
jgi:hypothetical protein